MRTLRKTDIQVVVTPRREGDLGMFSISGVGTPESNARHLEAEAQRIEAEIRRHVSDFATVTVTFKRETACGSDPYTIDSEGDSTRWWPECCEADQREYFDLHAHESDQWFAEHRMGDLDWLQEFRDAAKAKAGA